MARNEIPVSVGNRYRLLKPIGNGGMGIVYQALDTQTNQMTAVKLLKADALLFSPDLLERFIREGETLRQLNHPNIVKVLAAFEENDQHYIVMEYVSGGSLADRLKRQPRLPIDYILKIALEVADALSRAHHLKIIHRDIKPDNVLLAEDGTPRLTDFGVAHLANSNMTQSGVVVGTYPYLCPEAFNGQTLDTRTDIWAFGVMLFEMLAGHQPFEGATFAAIMTAILTQPTPDLEAIRPDAPIALIDLIYRMLEKNPDERIPSVRLVAAALESILSGVSTPLRPVARPVPFSTDPNSTVRLSTPSSVTRNYSHLPAQTTPFIGREDELLALAKLLDNSANRLITILGTGGMGKTRLSLESAAQHVNLYTDGVYFVELAPLSAAEEIVTAVAEAIGMQFTPGGDAKQQLLSAFHERKMLLIMDNFEHLLDGAQIVREILQAAPNVKILVTSRERLNQSGETVFILSGMDFPDWETPEDALEYGAVKLFLQSAKRAKSDFALAADDLNFLARICRLVAGMPLGIVLTAAWVSVLSLQEIADEIARSLDFLETDMQDIPERQRSIRGVFEYSYRRLANDEQAVFRKLSVFRGGCTREAAQSIAGASLKTLMALTNKSLLVRDPSGRYQIHELLRQFGQQQLIDTGEISAAQDSHAIFFAQFLSERWEDLKGRRQIGALAEIEAEYENIRVAWLWLVEQQRVPELGEAATSLWFYLDVSVRHHDGIELFDQAVKKLRPVVLSSAKKWVMGHLLARLLTFQSHIGPYEKCKALADEALAILREANHPEELFLALNSAAFMGVNFNHFDVADQVTEEGFRMAQQLGNTWAMRDILLARGAVLYFTGQQVEEGLRMMQESMTLAQAAGDLWLLIASSNVLWGDAMRRENFQEAEAMSRQNLKASELLDNRGWVSDASIHLGASLAHQGQDAEAKPYFQRGIRIKHSIGIARETLMAVWMSIEDYFYQVNKPFSVELLAMLLANPDCDNVISGWTEKISAGLKAELPPEIYNAAWKRGSQWSLDQAVALMLDRLN